MSQATELIARQMTAGSANARVWADILYNVKLYGAKGDGTTDDTAAIQATIDYAMSVGGKAVFFPHGTYKVTALTNLSSVVLFGDNASFVGISNTINQIGDSTTNLFLNVNAYASVQAAVNDAVLKGGGEIRFPAGTYTLPSTLLIGGTVILQGSGRDVTRLVINSLTDDIVDINANYVNIKDMTISRAGAGTPTSGASIKVSSGVGCTVDNQVVSNCYYGVNFVSASQWTIKNCYIVNHYKWGIYIRNVSSPDTGDSCMIGTTFDSAKGAESAIRHESSGGLKLVGNKILSHQYGYDLQVADGVSTSVLTMTGNSIEGQSISSIRLGRLGTTGSYTKIAIAGNQFSTPSSIMVGDGINEGIISGNTHSGTDTAPAISFTGGGKFFVGNENINNFSKGVVIAAGATSIHVGDNQYFSTIVLVENNAASVKEMNVFVNHLSLLSVTSDTTYTNYYQIDMNQFRGAKIDIVIEGILQTVGVFARYIQKVISRANAACTVTAISDTAAGAVIDVQFDTTTISGSVLIGLRRNTAAGGTGIEGNITIKVIGNVNKVQDI